MIAIKGKRLLKRSMGWKFGKNRLVHEEVKVGEGGRAAELTAGSPGGVLCKAVDP